MNKLIWLVIFFVEVVIQATSTNFAYAFGAIIGWFIVGMAFSPNLVGYYKEEMPYTPWQWFDWFIAGAYIMIGLQILSMLVRNYMKAKFGV